jgi:predicted transcriptional regulator
MSEDLDKLAAFLAVAEKLSFRQAGEELGVTPSAVSPTVRQLETRLGLQLFLRTTRSVVPDASVALDDTHPSAGDVTARLEPLVHSFVNTYSARYGMASVEIEPALIEAMKSHAWPGNVRELENTVARLLALAPDNRLTLALWRSLAEPAAASLGVNGVAAGDLGPNHSLRARVEGFERSIIAAEFDAAGRNQSETARRLGVSRPALIDKLHKYGSFGGVS